MLSLSGRLGLLALALHLLAALCPAHIPHGNHGNGVVNTGALAGTFKAGQTVLTRAPVSLKGTVVMETPIGSTTGKGFANLNSTSYWQRATGAINPSGSVPAAKTPLPSGPKPFAMGIDDHLDDFARTHGATTWKQLPDAQNWKPQVLDRLADPNQRVIFNLDDVDVWGGAQRAASGRGGATDWELLQIKQNDFPNLEFWQGSQQVPNPFR